MIPTKLKNLIKEYCTGVTPSDEQMDEIMDMVVALKADNAEVSAYMDKLIAGPSKQELDKATAKTAKEAQKKKEAANKELTEVTRKTVELSKSNTFVDLGLSVKWATCNVGASSLEECGDYFAWGETEPKTNYDWSTYKYSKKSGKTASGCDQPIILKYCDGKFKGDEDIVDNKTKLERKDDAASANIQSKFKFWGKDNRRTPTREEWSELEKECKWRKSTIGGADGYIITGKTGNHIFLPSAGYRYGTKRELQGKGMCYWSANPCPYVLGVSKAYVFSMNAPKVSGRAERCFGLPVRAVID